MSIYKFVYTLISYATIVSVTDIYDDANTYKYEANGSAPAV